MSADESKIHWSSDGRSIIICDMKGFITSVLKQFFKHGNFTSFLRQLNLYRFRTVKTYENYREFQNPMFVRDKEYLMPHITRKIQTRSSKSAKKKLAGIKSGGDPVATAEALMMNASSEVAMIQAVQGLQDALTFNTDRSRKLEQRVLELEATIQKMLHNQKDLIRTNTQVLF